MKLFLGLHKGLLLQDWVFRLEAVSIVQLPMHVQLAMSFVSDSQMEQTPYLKLYFKCYSTWRKIKHQIKKADKQIYT